MEDSLEMQLIADAPLCVKSVEAATGLLPPYSDPILVEVKQQDVWNFKHLVVSPVSQCTSADAVPLPIIERRLLTDLGLYWAEERNQSNLGKRLRLMYNEPFIPISGPKDVLYANYIAYELGCTKPTNFDPPPATLSDEQLRTLKTLHPLVGPSLNVYVQKRYSGEKGAGIGQVHQCNFCCRVGLLTSSVT
eukprot:Skav209386  [mRNA]  locus=scaffold3334:132385:132957:- [translate_table: standard]